MSRISARLLITVLFIAAAAPARADFDSLVRAVSRDSGLHRVRIPFLGFARMAVRLIAPEGVHDFQIAVFEGTRRIGGNSAELLQRHLTSDFRPVVKVDSARKAESTVIYARPLRGERIEVMLFNTDRSDTVLIRAEVDPKVFADDVMKHHRIRVARN